MSGTLSDQDDRVLEFLSRVVEERDDWISAKEIQDALGILSLDVVEASLGRLEREGYISRTGPDAPPGLRVLKSADGVAKPERTPSFGSRSLPHGSPETLSVSSLRALSPREKDAFLFIYERITTAYPPSIAEIKTKLGPSSTRVYELLEGLERKGYIRLPREPDETGRYFKRRKPHAIELVRRQPLQQASASTVQVPLLTRIRAGIPTRVEQGHNDWLELPRNLIGQNDPAEIIALVVEGDSMRDDGVLEGDRIIVRLQPEALNGDMVVVNLWDRRAGEREGTVKRYRRRGGHTYLEAANPNYTAIAAESAEIVGKVIGLLRYSV